MARFDIGPASDTLRELIAEYRAPLRAYFRRRVSSTAEADDLTQEVFLRILGQEPLPAIENVQAYVFVVAGNLLRDRMRKQAIRGAEDAVASQPLHADQRLVDNRAPDRVVLARDTLRSVVQSLDELGERTRTIFLLYRLEHMKQREIADMLGLSLSTVEKHLVKAVAHLAKKFGHGY